MNINFGLNFSRAERQGAKVVEGRVPGQVQHHEGQARERGGGGGVGGGRIQEIRGDRLEPGATSDEAEGGQRPGDGPARLEPRFGIGRRAVRVSQVGEARVEGIGRAQDVRFAGNEPAGFKIETVR